MRVAIFSRPDTFNILGFRVPAANWFNSALNRTVALRQNAGGGNSLVGFDAMPSREHGTIYEFGRGREQLTRTIWRIRPDLNWADGTPVTASDYKFTIDLSGDPDSGATDPEANSLIVDVELDSSDPKQFSLLYKRLPWNFAQRIGRAMPAHLERDAWLHSKGRKGGYQDHTLYRRAPLTRGLYTGPYTLEHIDDKIAVLRAVTPWTTRHDEIEVHFVQSASEAIDLRPDVVASPGITPQVLEHLITELGDTHRRYSTVGYWLTQVAMNTQEFPCSQRPIRQAIRNALLEVNAANVLWGEHANVASTILSEPMSDLIDGVRSTQQLSTLDRRDKPVEVDFSFLSNTATLQLASDFQRTALRHGVSIRPIPYLSSRYFADLRDGRLKGAYLLSMALTYEPYLDELFAPCAIADEKSGRQGENWSKWTNEPMQNYLADHTFEFDFNRRKKIYFDVCELIDRECPVVPLAYPPASVFVRRGMSCVEPPIGPTYETWNIEKWG